MKKCQHCYAYYTPKEVAEMLEAMFGGYTDEDYLVAIEGLCPTCWPEYC